jgi:hypothetical protein
MRAEDVEIAGAFLAALEEAAESGDREAVYPTSMIGASPVTCTRSTDGKRRAKSPTNATGASN